MAADLVNPLKPIVRIISMLTLSVAAGSLSAAKVQAQTPLQRYPLDAPTKPVTPNSIKDNVRKPVSENIGKLRAVGSSARLDETMTATRRKFAVQFQKAYERVASAYGKMPRSLNNTVHPSTGENSVVDFTSSDLEQDHLPEETTAEPPLVTPLPKIDDVTNRFPRVAKKTKNDFSIQSNGGSNDFVLSSVPPLPTHNNGLGALGGSIFKNGQGLNWWNVLVQRPLHPSNEVQAIDSNSLVYMALQNSPRIQALSRDPLIRDFEVVEAGAAFDPVSFLQSQFADRSDPLGGALDATRDGSDTIENHQWTAEGGIRRRTRTGATYELSQRLGFQNSNVAVFDPNNQGTAQIALNVTQPLARGRGRYVNQSQILIAQSRGGAAWESFAAELQEEIESVVAAYWRLYYDRSVFLQKKRNVERVAKILKTLEGRADLDSLPSQIARARSSLQTRKTDLANAFRDVRNSETEVRRLIADRNWFANQTIELLPVEEPTSGTVEISLQHVVTTSLENRPEIRETMQRAKLAGIERDISINDLLPELSLLIGTYISTLEDDGRVGRAFVDQFGETKPGYSVGVEFELPIGNRAARSRLIQRKLQLAKIRSQVDETMQNVIAESQTALRRLNSASETLEAANQAIEAAQSDLDQQFRRWENFALVEGDFSDGQTPTTVLDQLLDSQERLAAAELVAAQAQLELKVAEVALQRAMGTLLIQKHINPRRTFENSIPTMRY